MRTVAILDDDASVREALLHALGALGFAASIFASPQDLFAAVALFGFDCLLLDYHLPGWNGLAIQAELAAIGCTTPIVFISASAGENARRAALAAGAAAFLAKPLRLYELEALLHRLMPPPD